MALSLGIISNPSDMNKDKEDEELSEIVNETREASYNDTIDLENFHIFEELAYILERREAYNAMLKEVEMQLQ